MDPAVLQIPLSTERFLLIITIIIIMKLAEEEGKCIKRLDLNGRSLTTFSAIQHKATVIRVMSPSGERKKTKTRD